MKKSLVIISLLALVSAPVFAVTTSDSVDVIVSVGAFALIDITGTTTIDGTISGDGSDTAEFAVAYTVNTNTASGSITPEITNTNFTGVFTPASVAALVDGAATFNVVISANTTGGVTDADAGNNTIGITLTLSY